MSSYLKSIVLVSSIALLSGCGGGGGSDTPSNPPPVPKVVESGYTTWGDAVKTLFDIKGDKALYATDNGCVYPQFVHTDFYYEVYDDNSVKIKYTKSVSPFEEVAYSCAVTKIFTYITPSDGVVGADYMNTGSFSAWLYHDIDTNIYYDIHAAYSLDYKTTVLTYIESNGQTAVVTDANGDEEKVGIINVFKEQ
jgi:hypothetical protein